MFYPRQASQTFSKAVGVKDQLIFFQITLKHQYFFFKETKHILAAFKGLHQKVSSQYQEHSRSGIEIHYLYDVFIRKIITLTHK